MGIRGCGGDDNDDGNDEEDEEVDEDEDEDDAVVAEREASVVGKGGKGYFADPSVNEANGSVAVLSGEGTGRIDGDGIPLADLDCGVCPCSPKPAGVGACCPVVATGVYIGPEDPGGTGPKSKQKT